MELILGQILKHKLVVILRGIYGDDALKVASTLVVGGVKVLEVAIVNDQSIETLKLLNEKLASKLLLGAGTILDVNTAEKVKSAGAKFLLSPGLEISLMKEMLSQNTLFIPGAFTPSEMLLAIKNGAKLIKFFPAGGQERIFKSLQGPLPDVKLMPVGEVDLGNLADFHKMGAVAYGVGGSLVSAKTNWNEENLASLKSKTEQYVSLITTLN